MTTDVEQGGADAVPASTTHKLTGIRRIAARRMVQAWAAPVFHLGVDIDMTHALGTGRRNPGATVSDAIVEASARALKEVPELNGHFADESVTLFDAVNVGLAVATDAGLTVPVIHGADRIGLDAIAARRRDVVDRARRGRLGMVDIDGATFTVSNLGMMGVDAFDAIVNPPQLAILAIGATRPTPVAAQDQVLVRPMARFTLTCDHRGVDGAMGARLLAALKAALQADPDGTA